MEVIQQSIDGISFELKEPFNFDFIGQYGKVFKVYDDQDSGNICFGTERDGKRFFVKFSVAVYVIAAIAAAILLSACLLNVFKIAGVGKLDTTHLWLDVAAIVICVLAITAILLTVLSRYSFRDKQLVFTECVVTTKIAYENITDIIVDDEKGVFVLSCVDDAKNAYILPVNISKKRRDDFIKELTAKNSDVTYNICSGSGKENENGSRNSEQ